MTMRITVASASYAALDGLEAQSAKLAKLQAQMSSGNQITTPSDNPTGTVEALQLRSQSAANDQYGTSATDAVSWLSTQDSAYSQLVTLAQSARTQIVQALNTGAGDSTSANAIADSLDQIRQSLISEANTTFNGRPVFGGTTAGGVAYDSSGNYVGDDGAVTRQIGPNTTVTVSANGPNIFGADNDPTNLLTMLTNVANTLRTSPTSLPSSTLGDMDAAITRISDAQAVEGATYNQVQLAQTTQQSTATSFKTQLSGIQDIDIADMAVQITTANTTYQAALQTTASIRQLSLLNFLN